MENINVCMVDDFKYLSTKLYANLQVNSFFMVAFSIFIKSGTFGAIFETVQEK